MQALRNGCVRHGVRVDVRDTFDDDQYDMVSSWGKRGYDGLRPHLILEAGYINRDTGNYHRDRLRFISTSWNKPHGMSDGFTWNAPPDRWRRLGIEFDDWKLSGRFALMLSQHPNDYGAPSQTIWDSTRKLLEALYKVRERPHPLVAQSPRSLAEDLRDAHMAVTWTSTAAVEAVIAGVPTVALHPMCIASPVCSQTFDDPYFRGDRRQWAYNLMYRQWKLNEIADGSMWSHVYGRAFPT